MYNKHVNVIQVSDFRYRLQLERTLHELWYMDFCDAFCVAGGAFGRPRFILHVTTPLLPSIIITLNRAISVDETAPITAQAGVLYV